MEKIAVVIPVFNRIEDTLVCLDNLSKQTYKNFEIVLCDDNSSDNTYEIVSTNYSYVHLTKGNGDLWWTGGTNRAIQFAMEKFKDLTHILTLNNDVKIENDFIEKLLNTSNNNENSLICAASLTLEDQPRIFFGGCEKINWKTAKYKMIEKPGTIYDPHKHAGHVKSDYLIGRGLLVPVQVIHEIGLFNYNQLPQYFSDSDFSLRAKRAGYELLVDFDSPVYTIPNEATEDYKENNTLSNKLFNKRSPLHFKSRYNFAKLNCPTYLLPSYLVMDFTRICGSHFLRKTF